MRIKLSEGGKRFNREWIFRKATLDFTPAAACAITGPNGSGKSTLLQCISGMLRLSEGSIVHEAEGKTLDPEQAYRQVSYCAPYLDLVEEMTLLEFLEFHRQFKSWLDGFSDAGIIRAIGLEAAAGKQLRHYSSGMRQRVKLAQAIFSRTGVILLDEPCSNLDSKGIELYHQLIRDHTQGRLVIVCSNDPVEYSFCQQVVNMQEFK